MSDGKEEEEEEEEEDIRPKKKNKQYRKKKPKTKMGPLRREWRGERYRGWRTDDALGERTRRFPGTRIIIQARCEVVHPFGRQLPPVGPRDGGNRHVEALLQRGQRHA